MGELRQYHPGLKVSSIKALPKGDFVLVGDSLQDLIILQSETKMKAAFGQKVKISLPKAFQTNKVSTKSLAVKGLQISPRQISKNSLILVKLVMPRLND